MRDPVQYISAPGRFRPPPARLPRRNPAAGPVDSAHPRRTGGTTMANPGLPATSRFPGIPGDIPPPIAPDDVPDTGPTGPRSPYPVNDPGITDPKGPAPSPITFRAGRAIPARGSEQTTQRAPVGRPFRFSRRLRPDRRRCPRSMPAMRAAHVPRRVQDLVEGGGATCRASSSVRRELERRQAARLERHHRLALLVGPDLDRGEVTSSIAASSSPRSSISASSARA